MTKSINLSKLCALALAAIGAASIHGVAHAEETTCTGRIGAVALDNVFVPDGASCVLDRTRLNGNLVVGRGASVQAGGVTINGSVQAEGASAVGVGGFSSVGGSIQIVQGGSASIEQTRINGDLLFDSNVAPLSATRNRIGGNLQAFQNLGGVNLVGNTINGNLQCKENIPAPTGRGNRAASKEDQCERL